MSFLAFLLEAVVISLSGVMAPGPVTAVTVGKGSESPHAGALVAIGHGAVEFPLMVAVFYGLGALFDLPYVESIVGLVGGLLLLWMAVGMFRSVGRLDMDIASPTRSPVMSGVLLSLGNPYFLIWWATVGLTLVTTAKNFGAWAFVLFALVHWSCDLVWLTILSWGSFKGASVLSPKRRRAILLFCAIALVGFGLYFLTDKLIELVRLL